MTPQGTPSLLRLLTFLLFVVTASSAAAESALVHTVRPGETWDSIADLYYGKVDLRSALQAQNGLRGNDSLLVPGMQLMIPKVSFHLTEEGDTWRELANRYYRNPDRYFVLIETNSTGNPGKAVPPEPGAYLIIPYPVRHEVIQNETLRSIARLYYGDNEREGIRTIRRFNDVNAKYVQRGQLLLIPMANLRLSEQGEAFAEEQGIAQEAAGDKLEKQQRINALLPDLARYVKEGQYIHAVAMANELLGKGDLTGNQMVTIQRELGTALVALGENELAIQAFAAAVKQQQDLELDMARTSPKVLHLFELGRQQAKKALDEAQKAALEGVGSAKAK